MIRVTEKATYKGVSVDGFVMTIDVVVKKTPGGCHLIAILAGLYASEAAMNADPEGNKLPNAFPSTLTKYDYDRTNDGTDVLMLAHNMYVQFLTTVPNIPMGIYGGNFEPTSVTIFGL